MKLCFDVGKIDYIHKEGKYISKNVKRNEWCNMQIQHSKIYQKYNMTFYTKV